jgi:heme/copper-type cytochrome/quinol oxidase subunit 2
MAGIAPSVVDPGPQAAHISSLWWLMFWVSAAIFTIVLGALAAFCAAPARACRSTPTGR